VPTATPSELPSHEPSQHPTAHPTAVPTFTPTPTPTEEPTAAPTREPTRDPTHVPTLVPTEVPTHVPSLVSGAAGSNECPAGSVRIETEDACRSAAAAAGKTYGYVGTWTIFPGGCFYQVNDNNAFFNTEVVGAANPNAQLLCAAATTGARPRRCGRGEPNPVQMWQG
jgi:hypothetical protein